MMQPSHAAQLHYRCVFNLTPSPGSTSGWGDLVRAVRSWVTGKTPTDKGLLGQWFFKGGEWKPAGSPRVCVKTDQAVGSGNESRPDFWAVRFEHPCSVVSFRQWRTDVGVTVLNEHDYQIAVAVSHWILPGYIGEEPSTPAPSSPNLVSTFIRSKRWRAFAGTEPLSIDPILLVEGRGNEFKDRLENPDRHCPIVLVSCEVVTGVLKIDSTRLARQLAGAATAFVAESHDIDAELWWLIPESYRCPNGMVRVYQPKVRFDSPGDFRRHRFFTREQIDALTPDVVVDTIVRGVVRRSRSMNTAGVSTVEDVWGKRREDELREMRARLAGEPALQEWMDVFEWETEQLQRQLKESAERVESLEHEIDILEEAKDNLEVKVSSLDGELDHVRSESNVLREVNRQLKTQNESVQLLEKLPETVLEVIDLIGRLHPDKIVFTERAFVSARDASLVDAGVAWSCVWGMATVLHGLHFGEERGGDMENEFRTQTGFDLALTEVGTTKKDRDLMELRKCKYNGQEIDITPHAKYGGADARKCLRVHYHAHQEERRLIVCHCGDHLPTSGTRRRK